MSNYTTLQRNTLDGFSESAGCLYFKLLDVFEGHTGGDGERKAFLAADRYERDCAGTLDYILRNGPFPNLDDRTRTELSRFFAERWRHNFMEKTS